MIYEEDVREASMFFPEEGEVVLVVRSRKLLPFVRRELTGMFGTPSITGEVYTRFGGLKIFTLVAESDMLENVRGDTNASMYYVREKGERIAPLPSDMSFLQDIKLLSMCMPESDMWLYLDNKYLVMGTLHPM